MSNEEKDQISFLKGADKNLHDNIIYLDQKLRGMLQVIQLKMKESAKGNGLTEAEKKQLPALAEEIKKALGSIENLINTVVPEGLTLNEFEAMNQDVLQSLRAMFQLNADKIGKF